MVARLMNKIKLVNKNKKYVAAFVLAFTLPLSMGLMSAFTNFGDGQLMHRSTTSDFAAVAAIRSTSCGVTL